VNFYNYYHTISRSNKTMNYNRLSLKLKLHRFVILLNFKQLLLFKM